MRVLVTGAAGQVGAELHRHCSDEGDDVAAFASGQLDLSERDQVLGAVASVRPDVIVNLGARTDVDGCESDPDGAWRVNTLGARHVAEAARRFGAHLVHFSTDYVFDGEQEEPYREWDRVNPRSVYGRTKAASEREVLEGAPGACVLRTSWVCGRYGTRNIPRTIVNLLRSNPVQELRFVEDQRGNPTLVESLVPVVRSLAVARLPGIVHATNDGATSWYEFARAVVEAAGGSPDQVRPITTSELDPPRPAPRPANSVLDNYVLRTEGGPQLGPWGPPLSRLVKELAS